MSPERTGLGQMLPSQAFTALRARVCVSVIQTRLKKKTHSVRSEAAHEAEKRDERERKR